MEIAKKIVALPFVFVAWIVMTILEVIVRSLAVLAVLAVSWIALALVRAMVWCALRAAERKLDPPKEPLVQRIALRVAAWRASLLMRLWGWRARRPVLVAGPPADVRAYDVVEVR